MNASDEIVALGGQDLFSFAEELIVKAKRDAKNMVGRHNGAHQGGDSAKDFIFTVTPETTIADIQGELEKYLEGVDSEYASLVMHKFRERVGALLLQVAS